ncbi:MAG TPA: ATP-grasp domain-containing protein [Candidatus Kapabacteria bacterium]|nr:ATP-grasp domain-containing protein [Candidatus Kapabacteria bacterium]
MARPTTVALLYNDIPGGEEPASKIDFSPEALGFTPYFDLEETGAEQEYASIEKALAEAGYKVVSFNVKDRFERLFNFLTRRKFDVIFNLIEFFHSRPENEMLVAGFFDLLQVPYTGAPPLALATCQNKPLAKELFRAHRLPTARSFTVRKMDEFPTRHGLRYPVIVKPAWEDGSGGIENASIVKNLRSLRARVDFVLSDFKMPVLIEEYIDGRELNVAVLGNGTKKQVLPISEIVFDTMPDELYKIVSYQAKWDPHHAAYHTTIPSCPADIPQKTALLAQQYAFKATEIMGTRDYARVDMRMNKRGELFILEVNPNPNLSEGTGIARSAEAAHLKFSDLLRNITESALERAHLVEEKDAN